MVLIRRVKHKPAYHTRPANGKISALILAFLLKAGTHDAHKGAMWPADEYSCPPLI